jgi:hypothetical protein
VVINGYPGSVRAASQVINPSDIEYSEPFELTASIMEIDYGKNILVVAENKIQVVDLTIGDEFIRTELTDAAGNDISFDSLDRGQTVSVVGMKLPDGRFIAEEIVLKSRRTDD